MSAPIGPGDWVELAPKFYRAEPWPSVTLSGPWPSPGRIYQVREVGMMNGDEPAIRLVGIVASYPGHPDCWWPLKHFRPTYRPNADFIEQLKRPAKNRSPGKAPGRTPEYC